MSGQEVRRKETDGVLVLTIDRPKARNAVDRATSEQLADGLDELDRRDDLHVGVLTGGGGTFCAGMDLKAFTRGETPVVEGRGFAGLAEALPRKPLIAAVEGYALAGGFEIVLSCDLVVAARSAQFGLPEVRRSLVAAGGGLLRLPRRVPYHQAMEMALTGEPITAERARELGLVNRLVDDGQALACALELARTIAANGPLAVAATKQVLLQAPDWPQDEAFARQHDLTSPVFASADAREGATAFAEKRRPVWTGR